MLEMLPRIVMAVCLVLCIIGAVVGYRVIDTKHFTKLETIFLKLAISALGFFCTATVLALLFALLALTQSVLIYIVTGS